MNTGVKITIIILGFFVVGSICKHFLGFGLLDSALVSVNMKMTVPGGCFP